MSSAAPGVGSPATLSNSTVLPPARWENGQVFPAYSRSNSDAGKTDWAAAEEKILRDVFQWLSSADLRRARLVCKPWLRALSTLSTRATTPPETGTVTKWKSQLEAMILALPCLQQITVGGKLSAVAAQQLSVLSAAEQLRVLSIPQGQALQDRSLMALQPLAATLRELRIRNAASLTQRSLLQLSVFRDLEVLELKHCGKVSWCELQEAWRMACMTYEMHVAEAAAPAAGSATATSYSKGSIFGGWLPAGGRIFRISSPSSNTMLAAVAKQKSGGGSTSGFLASLKGRGGGSRAYQLGKGAVGNGRSSSGGGPTEMGPVRSFLQRKQKQQMATAASAPGELSSSCDDLAGTGLLKEQQGTAAPLISSSSSNGLQRATEAVATDVLLNSQQQQTAEGKYWSIAINSDAAADTQQSTAVSPTTALHRVGSLVWQGTTAAAAALSSGSIARQSSAVQAALLAYLAENGGAGYSPGLTAAGSLRLDHTKSIGSDGHVSSNSSGSPFAAVQSSSSTLAGSRFAPNRRQPMGDKPLPPMPFTRLMSLSFTCSEATYKRPGPEIAAIATLTTLTHLELGKCKLPGSVFWRLSSLTRLSKLKLTELWSLGDEGLAELAKLTNLKSLSLSEAMHVTGAGLQALDKLTGLTALALGLTQDLGPGTVAKVASGFLGLRCLEVTASCWCDVDCERLAELAAEVNLAEAASVAAGAAQLPLMLWNVSRASSPTCGLSSRSSSNKLLTTVAPPLSASSSRSNSSMNLSARPTSINSMPSFGSFGSFNGVPASSTVQQPHQPQRLLVLKLHGCCTVGHRGMAALKQLKHLHTLVLDNCKQVHAAEVISQDLLPPNLVSLSLKRMPFGNAFSGCVNVPTCASSLTKLELVSLSAVHSGQVRRLLNFFTNLQELSMAGSLDIGDAAVQQIVLPKLLQLNLTSTHVTNHGLEQLMYLPALKALCLKGCNLVTDAGLLVLEMYPALQELELSECTGVSERGVLAAMQGVKGLVSLNICGCKALSRGLLHGCPHYLHIKHTL